MSQKPSSSTVKTLGIFTLAMINVAAIVSLRNLPITAKYGLGSIFFYGLAGIAFFIPIALVAAELATAWPGEGGIYVWVKEAFGPVFGFLVVWLEWVMNAVWYPTVLTFAGATLAFTVNPGLANNKLYMVVTLLVILWGATLANFFGMRASGLISSVGSIAGTVIPGVLIIILAVVYLALGKPSQMSFAPSTIVPPLHLGNMVFFAGVVLGLAGIEMAAFHANEVKNPQRDYPKAILISVVVILGLFVIGSLAIAVVVPVKQINLQAGLMQAFQDIFDSFGIGWLLPVIALLVAIGAVAQLSTWIAGPSKGLLATARNGDLPPFFQHVNRNRMPTHILIVQAGIGTVLALVILLMPSVQSSYWMLTALTAQLTCMIYVLIFAAAIGLRYKYPNAKRPFKIPGGVVGMWAVAGLGLVAVVFTLFIGFVPPDTMKMGSPVFFVLFLVAGLVIMVALPFIIQHFRQPSWKMEDGADQQVDQ